MNRLSRLLRVSLIGAVLGVRHSARIAQDATQALAKDSVIEKIKKRGSLRAGLSTFVPWAFPDKNGKLVGFEVDVINKLAEGSRRKGRAGADQLGRHHSGIGCRQDRPHHRRPHP